MRVFVAYGYNDRDKWIVEMVFPLIEALGCEVVTGEVEYGGPLSEAVRDAILTCDSLFGFRTRRKKVTEEDENGNTREFWTTHRWVVEELAVALNNIPTVEVCETGVEPQKGMQGDAFQRITYDETKRDACLLEIAQAVAKLRQERSHKAFKLGPQEFVKAVRQQIKKPGFKCTFRTLRHNQESAPQEGTLRRVAGGLELHAHGVRDTDLVEISVVADGTSWVSGYETVDKVRIDLEEEV